MSKDLASRIEDALMYKPNILQQYIVTNVRPCEEIGAYLGDIEEGVTVYFHEYRQMSEDAYEAIQYDIDVRK